MNAKKLLLGTLGLVASLGMSANSLAYYGETTAPDFPSGFYIGLQGGYAHTYWKDLDGLSNLDPIMLPIQFDGGTGSYAGRAYVGYDFNEFFALELGWAYFHGGIAVITNTTGPAFDTIYSKRMKASAGDLVAKLSLPLDNGFRLFTKVGLSYYKAGTAPLFVGAAPVFFVDDPSRKNVNIVFGLGASYAITPAFSADIAWSFYRGDNQIGDKYIPETDFYTLGLSYKFICS